MKPYRCSGYRFVIEVDWLALSFSQAEDYVL
jgi:hypothetical protein